MNTMTLSTKLWLTLFGLTLTDFYLTSNLIYTYGLDVEANSFMRYLFGKGFLYALTYKLASFFFLFAMLRMGASRKTENYVLTGIVILYTMIVLYSLWLTYA